MKQNAFGPLKLKPDEFWKMTLIEYLDMLDAYIETEKVRQELEWERTAWQTAHLLNISGKSLKKEITSDMLLGKEKPKANKHISVDESKKRLADLKSKFNAD